MEQPGDDDQPEEQKTMLRRQKHISNKEVSLKFLFGDVFSCIVCLRFSFSSRATRELKYRLLATWWPICSTLSKSRSQRKLLKSRLRRSSKSTTNQITKIVMKSVRNTSAMPWTKLINSSQRKRLTGSCSRSSKGMTRTKMII